MASSTDLFVFVVSFWAIMVVFSGLFEVALIESGSSDFTDETGIVKEDSKTFMEKFFDVVDKIPFISNFNPLFKIMLFQYSDKIPAGVSHFLNIIALFSAYVIFSMFKGND